MTIENFGGAAYACYGSAPEFTRCNFTDNTADPSLDPTEYVWPDAPEDIFVSYGGTIATEDGAFVKLVDCDISGGNASIGGGIYWSDAEMEIIDSDVSGNIAYHGAGLYSVEASGTITGSVITGNQASIGPYVIGDPNLAAPVILGEGGGYYCLSSTVDISDSTFTENWASASGGALYYIGSDQDIYAMPTVHNCLLAGNMAGRDGGAISANWYAELVISNCTIADNAVTSAIGLGYGGGLYCSYDSNTVIVNSIIWGNCSLEGSQVAIGAGSEYESRPSAVTIINSDIGPRFDPNKFRVSVDINDLFADSLQQDANSTVLVDGQTIYDQFDAGEQRVKLIISLIEPVGLKVRTDWDSPESVSLLRAEIARRQDEVLSTLTPAEFSLRHRFENQAGFSGEITIDGLNKLLSNPLVAYIEPVRQVGPMLAQAIPLANALQIREVYDGSGIAIGISDSGVDYTHPKLGNGGFPNAKVIGGYDFEGYDNDPMPDYSAHGTCCAGIAAGDLGRVGDYIGGVAPDAKIYSLKIVTYGTLLAYTDSLLRSWDWSVTHRNDDPRNPIKVISNSTGIYTLPFNNPALADAFSPAHTLAAETAVAAGITVLAASGNDGFAGQGISWPSAISKIISVGAVQDITDQVMFYSNTADMLDVLAPADPMYTTDVAGDAPYDYDPGDYYPYFDGTSSACPFVAGAVACIQNAALEKLGRYLTPGEVKSLLIATGKPVTDTKVAITKPRVNLAAAIASLGCGPPIYVEGGCKLNGWVAPDTNSYWSWDTNSPWPDSNTIDEDPNFVHGYYLSQFAAGQITESNCVDGGSELANTLGMDTYTTRVDGVNDVNMVDMGYHYRRGIAKYQLTVNVIGGHGTAEPNSGWYYDGAIVTLTAKADAGYYLKGWYDVNDVLVSFNKRFDIVMDSNQVFNVRFRLPTEIEVSGGTDAIHQAVDAAENGDTLIVAAGTYDGDINFRGKELRLFSTNPDDPKVVARTIIDCQNSSRGFTFDSREDGNTIIDGFTIINGIVMAEGGGAIYIGYGSSPTIANIMISDCNVSSADGGAIYIDSNSSSLFMNVTISNCQVTNYNGGAIYIGSGSSPLFGYCTITDCSATEGSGGAVYCDANSSAGFTKCTFADNFATYDGGAVYYNVDCYSVFSRCSFTGNTASTSGGGIYSDVGCTSRVTNCTFAGNSAFMDGGAILHDANNLVTVTDCNFIDNFANYGGALYFDSNCLGTIAYSLLTSNDANEDGGAIYFTGSEDLLVADCNISYNTAVRGGGLYCTDSPAARIVNCTIIYNEGRRLWYEFFNRDPNNPNQPIGLPDPNGQLGDPNYIAVAYVDESVTGEGGGIYWFAGPGLIKDCDIGYNTVNTSGGGVYFAGDYVDPNLRAQLNNCLITNNAAGRDGSGVSVNWQSKPKISNCTIADNTLTDPNGYGAGLYCSYESHVELNDCIIWGNRGNAGTNGVQIAVASGDLPYPLPSTLGVSYSDVEGWRDVNEPNWIDVNEIFVDSNCTLIWDFNNILDTNPLFVGGYYLSHIATGQSLDSRCIDAGSGDANDPDIDMAGYTTRIDGVNDVNIVDIGYHYPIALHRLTIQVVGGNGSVGFDPNGFVDVAPNSQWYNHNARVTLTAVPDPDYRVNGWYDVNDVLLFVSNRFDVVMHSDQLFRVRFEPKSTVEVSGGGNAIQQAIDAAMSGDTLIVAAGTYDGDINLQGKDITVVSTNPDDPDIISQTIIDGQLSGRGFIFNSNEGPNTIIDGFMIINGSITGQGGGGIYVDVNSSPTIKNVAINNCSVTGADGGAIYVDANSSPRFINCLITNCSADNGGGAHCDVNSSPIFYHCTFGNNSAAQVGGGMLCDPNVSITVEDCNFTDNTASFGGALYCAANCSGEIINTILERNDATEDGGAIYFAEANDLSVADCNISYNTALHGAGIYSLGSLNLTISGCELTFNQAPLGFVDPNDPNTSIVGQGGAVYSFATEALIRDCVLTHNSANTSGGGMYLAGESDYIDITNCLIINNMAGRDGGGISVNWYAEPNIVNCTFASNAAPGTFGLLGSTGFGGGLYCSYHSNVEVIDSIFWNNYALMGLEIAVATGFEFDPRPAKLMLSHSDIRHVALSVWVDSGCILWDPNDPSKRTPLDVSHPNAPWLGSTNNIDADPLFVTGPLGNYYLSHIGAGQDTDSPCIDAGSNSALYRGLTERYTTRVDNVPDAREVDMGYHYTTGPETEECRLCDLDYDGVIDFNDLAVFVSHWLDDGCLGSDAGCEGTDFTFDTFVDFADYAFFANCWLVEDVCAPVPNPSEWLIAPYMTTTTAPYTISMTARTAFDGWGWPVQYYFQGIVGSSHESGWQDSPTWQDTGLDPNVYGYRVKAKDALGNETLWSVIAYAGTGDVTPPTPEPAWDYFNNGEPTAISPNSITMTSTISSDESGVEYGFWNTTLDPLGLNVVWQDEPNYTDVNLMPNTIYCYRVAARDKSANQNQTNWFPSPPMATCETTWPPPDMNAPIPDLMLWDMSLDVNNFDGQPREIYGGGGQYDYYVTMRADPNTVDVAPLGVAPSGVEFYFLCTNNGDFTSGWISFPAGPPFTYTTLIGRNSQGLRFKVKARDTSANRNETAYSEERMALPP
jgi:predicted outer membrane repeat protein